MVLIVKCCANNLIGCGDMPQIRKKMMSSTKIITRVVIYKYYLGRNQSVTNISAFAFLDNIIRIAREHCRAAAPQEHRVTQLYVTAHLLTTSVSLTTRIKFYVCGFGLSIWPACPTYLCIISVIAVYHLPYCVKCI